MAVLWEGKMSKLNQLFGVCNNKWRWWICFHSHRSAYSWRSAAVWRCSTRKCLIGYRLLNITVICQYLILWQ